MNAIPQSLSINEPSVISETIDGEVVIINLDKGCYYSLRGTGADIWALIEKGTETDAIIEQIDRRYDGTIDQVRESMVSFITKLVEEEIVRLKDVGANGTSSSSLTNEAQTSIDASHRQSFKAPELEVYTDMQHLLLLDPIHDVDETGWPEPK